MKTPPRSRFWPATDVRLLFGTRMARLFAYGFLSVVLVLHLAAAGLSEAQIGLLLTLTLIGDMVISLGITTVADRIGRRSMLLVGAALMVFAGGMFTLTTTVVLLFAAATLGVLSPSGSEAGPFLSIEQAAIAQIIPAEQRTRVFAWYSLVGSFATAGGALAGGGLAQALQTMEMAPLASYRVITAGYAAMGLVLALFFLRLSPAIEALEAHRPAGKMPSTEMAPGKSVIKRIQTRLGLPQSGRIVFKLSALFSLDAFGGGFVLQSILAYWFYVRFGAQPAMLGGIFWGANMLAGLSAPAAARVASRFGLVNTMVFTHIPSNILLMLVPLMPTLPWAIAVLLLRFSISQMDVPTRQSYTIAIVPPGERAAAAGVTSIARSVGSSLAPVLAGKLMSVSLLSAPFFLAGSLKIVYDLLLYRSFRSTRPPEEEARLS